MNFRICPVGIGSAAELAAVHALAFDDAWSAGDIATLMTSPGAFVLACEEAPGAPIGFVLARVAGDEAEILTLATVAAFRRQGVGAALMNAAALRAAAAGAQALLLEVADDNPGAMRLYEGLGLRPVGRRPAYYQRPGGPAAAAVIMRRELGASS